jgi:hypothetical protein
MSNLALVVEDEFIEINDQRHLLKVKVKHLAAEAKIIREEESQHTGMKKWGLQHHRKTTVRRAARQSQFAYAIIRGHTLQHTAKGYNPDPNDPMCFGEQKAIAKMVRKYGDPLNIAAANDIVAAWFET